MKHIKLFEAYIKEYSSESDSLEAGIKAFQAMGSILASDANHDKPNSAIQCSIVFDSDKLRLFFIATYPGKKVKGVSLESLGLPDSMSGFVFIDNDKHVSYYMGDEPEFLAKIDSKAVIIDNKYDNIYQDLKDFNEKWTETLEQGPKGIKAEDVRGMIADLESILEKKKRNLVPVEQGEQIPELG